MENIRDWCISRQLWWGHQIPAYYHNVTGEMVVAKENPDPSQYTQETDVLDTWFSSGLWPFSTMGFPNKESEDYKKFYPTSVLVTGFDIIFFWVARMITMGYEFTDKAPFSTVYIHGLIRDEQGQKMSKSKGNTIDPVLIIDKYGCDALRFTLTSLCTYGGQDIKISDERFEYGRNFANKIWNASRFVLMNLEGVDNKTPDMTELTLADKWILNELNNTAKAINENIESYRIGEVAHIFYDFFRSSYCDWYVELAKIQLADKNLKLNSQRVLKYVLDMSLRLLHPVMPHLTEQIWQLIPNKNTDKIAIMLEQYPEYRKDLTFESDSKQAEFAFEAIKAVRNARQSINLAPSVSINAEIRADKNEKAIFEMSEEYLKRLCKIENLTYADTNGEIKHSTTATVGNSKIVIPLEGLINIEDEIKRQQKKLTKVTTEKNSLEARMKNEKFIANAPEELVAQSKERIEELKGQEESINTLINSLK